jgi:hypothetical protein
MKTGKTTSGFEYEIDDAAVDDMELIEDLAIIDGGNISPLPGALNKLLGEDQKKRLYEHFRGKDGRVPASKVLDEIKAIFESIGDEGKK